MAWGQAFAFCPRVICEAISLLKDLKEACWVCEGDKWLDRCGPCGSADMLTPLCLSGGEPEGRGDPLSQRRKHETRGSTAAHWRKEKTYDLCVPCYFPVKWLHDSSSILFLLLGLFLF